MCGINHFHRETIMHHCFFLREKALRSGGVSCTFLTEKKLKFSFSKARKQFLNCLGTKITKFKTQKGFNLNLVMQQAVYDSRIFFFKGRTMARCCFPLMRGQTPGNKKGRFAFFSLKLISLFSCILTQALFKKKSQSEKGAVFVLGSELIKKETGRLWCVKWE